VISTVGVGGSWQPIGTPEAIADELIQVMEYIGGDGVMLLANDVGDDPYITNVTERLVPALQRAGAMQTAYHPGTLRDKLLSF
jgi:alkanesulfonate monooxygenase SsuD/methylene tetrahydromethanopterin reductase-like flavin-dependent oxidoreductase (luciferase family)